MVLILNVNTNVLLSSSVSQPISLHNVFKLIERVTPETILAASICYCSSVSFSCCAQLSQTTDVYSSIGLRDDIYIWFIDLRRTEYLSFLMIPRQYNVVYMSVPFVIMTKCYTKMCMRVSIS